jgi:hypothetical protein
VARETPHERGNPADEAPAKQQIEDKDCGTLSVAAIVGDDGREKVDEEPDHQSRNEN